MIFVFKVEKIDLDMMIELLPTVSDYRKKRIENLLNYKDKYNSFISELMIAYSLGINIRKDRMIIKTNNFNRPYVKNQDCLDFNISHCNDCIVLCTMREDSVGIDIESISNVNLEMVDLFCNEEELDIFQKENENPLISYVKIWTSKEAILKKYGLGLIYNVYEVKTKFINESKSVVKYNGKIHNLQHIYIEDYVITATFNDHMHDVKQLKLNDILM